MISLYKKLKPDLNIRQTISNPVSYARIDKILGFKRRGHIRCLKVKVGRQYLYTVDYFFNKKGQPIDRPQYKRHRCNRNKPIYIRFFKNSKIRQQH